jgi:hypothetical protein
MLQVNSIRDRIRLLLQGGPPAYALLYGFRGARAITVAKTIFSPSFIGLIKVHLI